MNDSSERCGDKNGFEKKTPAERAEFFMLEYLREYLP
jgi:hypothetical protein